MRVDIDQKKDQITEWLEQGISRSEICRRLQCRYDTLAVRLRKWNLNHLKNQGGKGFPKQNGRVKPEDYLCNDSTLNSHPLKLRLWRDGLKPQQCEECGWAERSEDGRLPLELDHINGNRFDNRIENLRVLCPNCHSLRPTHAGLNKGTYNDGAVSQLVEEIGLDPIQ